MKLVDKLPMGLLRDILHMLRWVEKPMEVLEAQHYNALYPFVQRLCTVRYVLIVTKMVMTKSLM